MARATDRSQSASVKKLNRTRSLAWAASIAVAVTVGWYARFSVSGPSPNEEALQKLQEPQVTLSRNEVPQAEAVADADEARTGVAGAVQPAPTGPARQRDRVSSTVQEGAGRGFREGAGVDSGAEREVEQDVERALSVDRLDAPVERLRRVNADRLAAAADSAAQGDSIVPVAARVVLRVARKVEEQNRFAVAGAPAAFSDDEAWTDLTLQEAERRIGRRILIVEGLEILRVSIASVAANASVRVVQRLSSGDSLEIVQQPLAEVDRVAGVLQARAEAVPAEEMAADARTVSTMSVARGELWLTLRAPVAHDSLQALSSRLRESPSTN